MAVGPQTRLDVFKRDGFRCLDCGNSENLTVDHITPRSHGGNNHIQNLRTLCEKCNSAKGNYTPTWRERLFGWIFTRKEVNNLKNNIKGWIISGDTGVEERLNKDFRRNLIEMRNKVDQQFKERSVNAVGNYNTLKSMIEESRKREDRLLELIYLLCDYLEPR